MDFCEGLGGACDVQGDGCCCFVSAKDCAGLKNCIYFTGSSFRGVKDDFPGWDAGLFDMEDNVAQPLKSVIGYS